MAKKRVDPEATMARAHKLLGGDGRAEQRIVGRALRKLGPTDFAALVHVLSSVGVGRSVCRRVLRSGDARAWLPPPPRKRGRYRGPGLFDEVEAAAGLTARRPRPLSPSGSPQDPIPAAQPKARRSDLRPLPSDAPDPAADRAGRAQSAVSGESGRLPA